LAVTVDRGKCGIWWCRGNKEVRNIKCRSDRYAFYLLVNTLSPKSSTGLSNCSRRQQVVTSYKSGLFKVTAAVREDSAVHLQWDCRLKGGRHETEWTGRGFVSLGCRGVGWGGG